MCTSCSILFPFQSVGVNEMTEQKSKEGCGLRKPSCFPKTTLHQELTQEKMTRGNQRELARAKNQKKQQETKNKKNADGLTLEQRKFRDAEMMREKQRKKEEEKGSNAQSK